MRTRKFITLLVLLGLLLLPFVEMRDIQVVNADDGDPPSESDETRMGQDLSKDDIGQEIQLEIPPDEEKGPEIVDMTLGLIPQSLPQTEVDQDSGVDDSPQALPSPSNESGSAIDSLNYNPASGMHVLDNFNRSDGGLGPGWTVHDGSFTILSEKAFGSGNGRATFNAAHLVMATQPKWMWRL